jgi:GntR family transcriptional regulator
MAIVISTASATPLYQQLLDQLSAQIVNGELEPDFCLPPIRTVAKDLRISVITVKKAWEELERLGLIYTVVGRGSFVAPHASAALLEKRDSLALQRLRKEVDYYKGLGLSLTKLLDLVRRCWNA